MASALQEPVQSRNSPDDAYDWRRVAYLLDHTQLEVVH